MWEVGLFLAFALVVRVISYYSSLGQALSRPHPALPQASFSGDGLVERGGGWRIFLPSLSPMGSGFARACFLPPEGLGLWCSELGGLKPQQLRLLRHGRGVGIGSVLRLRARAGAGRFRLGRSLALHRLLVVNS